MKGSTVLLIGAGAIAVLYLLGRKSAAATAAPQGPNYNAYAPIDYATPLIAPGTISNPLTQLISVLPYSRKQAIIDTPASLPSDQLFTPGANSGSGGYLDSDPTGTSFADGSGSSTYYA